MNAPFKIERGIPIPPISGQGRRGRPPVYPLGQLRIGESFLIRLPEGDKRALACKRLAAAACSYGKLHEKKFTIRTVGDGVRCWRVA